MCKKTELSNVELSGALSGGSSKARLPQPTGRSGAGPRAWSDCLRQTQKWHHPLQPQDGSVKFNGVTGCTITTDKRMIRSGSPSGSLERLPPGSSEAANVDDALCAWPEDQLDVAL